MLDITETDYISQSPFSSPFNIQILLSINVLQLKGDALRCCLSYNQLTSFVQGSSPFEIQIFLEYSCCFQRGIQGDWEHFSIYVLKYFLISPFRFLIFYSYEISEISGICNPPLIPPLILKLFQYFISNKGGQRENADSFIVCGRRNDCEM